MPFDKVEPQVDFPAQERSVLEFWETIHAFDALREKNKAGPRWSFLDGPITANNPMGVHHAWGRTYKDAYQRFHAMLGHRLRYQNGFDCQGLWVEVEVEKELKLKSKRDIENLVAGQPFASIDRFVQLCKQRVDTFAKVQTEQSIRLGYWMDWDNGDDWSKPAGERKSYFTMSEENNYTIWSFLKKCHDRELIYRGYDAMPWCPRCGVGLSEMEVKEGYKLVEHRAVFVKFPLRDRPGENLRDQPVENLLVWTTTPWTLTSNVAAAVNPDLTYLKVQFKGEIYYLAKGAFKADRMAGAAGGETTEDEEGEEGAGKGRADWLPGVPHLKTLEQMFKEKSREGFTIIGEVKGAEMVGRAYDGPFDDLLAQQHPAGYPEEVARRRQQLHALLAEEYHLNQATMAVQNPTLDSTLKPARDMHRVVAWKDVGETEGTGIVHIAPGCGKEDFQLGKEQSLPWVAPLGDDGMFIEGFGSLTGKNAADPNTADAVFEQLKANDRLFATERYVHRYPHCWRCKTELLFRLVDEWFIDMGKKPWHRQVDVVPGLAITETEEVWVGEEWGEDVPDHERVGEDYEYTFRTQIKKVVEKVTFLPDSLGGQSREIDWLRNMGDWMISKKRFWGLALPIWVDEVTGDFEVIGSREELKARAVEGWERFEGHTPHRPWVDVVKIRNPKTGNLMSRIPDVGNPWLDAGIVPYSTMGYNRDREYWKQWFPADFITESFPGQFRNWFYALLTMSTMMENRPPFKVLFGHALVRDQNGQLMSKSKGNSIEFNGAADSGYELFCKREPKLTVEQQAKKDLPAGYLSCREDEVVFDGQPLKVVKGAYKPMGADVVRWLYCRQNPAANLNMGPGVADELRAKFTLKLWNVYSFFCNYARLDGFDPNAQAVPLAQRTDFDRWILSELQRLIGEARKAFESYNVMAFCLEAERFVDDDLSNWYVRRNRERFQKSEKDEDKQSAHQTLYTVLVTLTKLFAPIMPFLTETMYQNLVVKAAGTGTASVHLCDYPQVDGSVLDKQLSADMEALQRLTQLGSAARNAVKIKVRQPLAELKVQPAADSDRRAVERFSKQIREELNVKAVTLYDQKNGPLLHQQAKPNMKTLGGKFKAQLQAVLAAIASANPEELAALARKGEPFTLGEFTLDPADVVVSNVAPEGWAGVVDRETQVAIDTRVTESLAREGMAREVIRYVQELRKDAKLEMEDRISLYLATDWAPLGQAIDEHRAYIAEETLTRTWASSPMKGSAANRVVKVDGKELTIELMRAET